MPTISNSLNFPVYLFDPMRIIVVVALVHTSRRNAYLLAIILPILSFILSNHPSLIKTGILLGDLMLNIFLFFYLTKFIVNKFLLMVISIVLSKMAYYVVKFICIKLSLLTGDLIATPIEYQVAIIIVLSGYVYFVNKFSLKKQPV
jgi:hypothetical protein